jgi:hypothetical protein
VSEQVQRWGALWHSRNRLDGVSEHLLWTEGDSALPALFRTRREVRAWIRARYGYIATRPDLRREPHGWRVPRPVQVAVHLVVAG